jgi:hypothetical protein
MTPTWTPARNSCRSCALMAKDMGEECHVARHDALPTNGDRDESPS